MSAFHWAGGALGTYKMVPTQVKESDSPIPKKTPHQNSNKLSLSLQRNLRHRNQHHSHRKNHHNRIPATVTNTHYAYSSQIRTKTTTNLSVHHQIQEINTKFQGLKSKICNSSRNVFEFNELSEITCVIFIIELVPLQFKHEFTIGVVNHTITEAKGKEKKR